MLSGTDGIDFDTVVLQVGKGSDDSRFAMAACLERKTWWEGARTVHKGIITPEVKTSDETSWADCGWETCCIWLGGSTDLACLRKF